MSKEKYRITTTICMIVAILSALLYERFESYQSMILAAGAVAAVISVGAYFMHHWPTVAQNDIETTLVEAQLIEHNIQNEILSDLTYFHMRKMVADKQAKLAEMYSVGEINISNHASIAYWKENAEALKVVYGLAQAEKTKIRTARGKAKGLEMYSGDGGFNLPEHLTVQ